MFLQNRCKKLWAVLLAMTIVFSGINFSFDSSYKSIIQLGGRVEAAAPVIISSWPSQNESFSENYTSIDPKITISNVLYQRLACRYYIDSEYTVRGTR
jgi:hypothetical protein